MESETRHVVTSVNTAATPWLGSRSSISRGMLARHGERSTECLASAQAPLACRHDRSGLVCGGGTTGLLDLVAAED